MESEVCIVDPDHGEFWQRPHDHTNGQGHPQRADQNRRLTLEQFIQKSNRVHNNLYDYSKIIYTGYYDKICIIDPIYGEFWQALSSHLYGRGNPERSCHKESAIHRDHIIPLTILGGRINGNRQRPLYEFLNSDINIQLISSSENLEKSDWIDYRGDRIRARNVKNNYEIISYLAQNLLATNIDAIIADDRKFLKNNK